MTEPMTDHMTTQEFVAIRENVRRAVNTLELCWRCQKVSECQKYILGNTVLVWLCPCCREEMDQPRKGRTQTPPKVRARNAEPALPSLPEKS